MDGLLHRRNLGLWQSTTIAIALSRSPYPALGLKTASGDIWSLVLRPLFRTIEVGLRPTCWVWSLPRRCKPPRRHQPYLRKSAALLTLRDYTPHCVHGQRIAPPASRSFICVSISIHRRHIPISPAHSRPRFTTWVARQSPRPLSSSQTRALQTRR